MQPVRWFDSPPIKSSVVLKVIDKEDNLDVDGDHPVFLIVDPVIDWEISP